MSEKCGSCGCEKHPEPKDFAGCPRCSSPLVSTLERAGYEWICVPCDQWYGWLSARARAWSPEAQDEYDEYAATYKAAREERRAARA